MFTETLTQRQAIASASPQTLNNTSCNTGNGLNMAVLRRARALLNVGAVTSTGSITFVVQSSPTSGGTWTNIPGSANSIVTTTANQMNTIEIRADQMPSGSVWLRAQATETSGQNVVVNLELIADEGSYKPASQFNTTTFTNQNVN